MHDLCGYAHGAAGIGHALAELFGATGEARFRDAAERAFDYERSWLDPGRGPGPTCAASRAAPGGEAPVVPAAESWCNGAPGIALSRLRADGAARVRRRCGATPRSRWRRASGTSPSCSSATRDDFCLCHGAAGAADVLLAGGGAELAAQVGRRGVERHSRPGAADFPCGVTGGETPGLMLGFAGIGMFYLRLADRGVESPLLIQRLTRTAAELPDVGVLSKGSVA